MWLAVIGVGFGICFGIAKRDADKTEDRHQDPVTPPPRPAEIRNVSPVERAPVYRTIEADSEHDRQIEDVAMRAVYDRCSKHYVFREGSTLEGIAVAGRKHGEIVNVSVRLADPSKAAGNTLWYQIGLDRKGVPKTITANKQISAQMCGMSSSEMPIDL